MNGTEQLVAAKDVFDHLDIARACAMKAMSHIDQKQPEQAHSELAKAKAAVAQFELRADELLWELADPIGAIQ